MLKESPTENSDTIKHVHAADTPKVKKKSTDFVLISPSTLPLTNCRFRFSKGLWDLYTIYHDNDISYRAIAKHKEYLP